MRPHSVFINLTGYDRPGVTSAMFAALAAHDVEVLDVEQVVIRGRLVLGVALALHGDPGRLRRAATLAAEALGIDVDVTISEYGPEPALRRPQRHHVIVLGRPLRAGALSELARRIADLDGNIDSITRLASHPVTALELTVSGADHPRLGMALVAAARETGTDIAVERTGLLRRSKRLLLLDLDTTLVAQDAWSLLAQAAGRTEESAQLLATTAAERGGRDRAAVIRARAALLAGTSVDAFDAVRNRMRCAPGAPTLVGALKRMGYRCGVVTGGVSQVAERMVDGLGLDFLAGNRLETADGLITGRIVGDVVDLPGRARALVRFGETYGVPLSQTIAVGGGEQDIDMLGLAGLGVTFNAGFAGQLDVDGTSRSQLSYLDPLLFVLGLSREDTGEPEPAGLSSISSAVP